MMQLSEENLKLVSALVRDVCGKYLILPEYNIMIFGSQVDGTASSRSDIDIAIDGQEPLPPGVIESISYELNELPLVYLFDVVDIAKVSDTFHEIAMSNIYYIQRRITEK